jgi:hypothetical protein
MSTEPRVDRNELELRDRSKKIMTSLPFLVQDIADEAYRNANWTPPLCATPAAICVLAACLVAASSDIAGAIAVDKGSNGKPTGLP